MNDDDKFWADIAYPLFVVFAWMFLAGSAILLVDFIIGKDNALPMMVLFGILLVIPMPVHGSLLTIWHWKSRYKGSHSKLWGALLMIENTGWARLIYFFRHVLPDKRDRGRYMRLKTLENTDQM